MLHRDLLPAAACIAPIPLVSGIQPTLIAAGPATKQPHSMPYRLVLLKVGDEKFTVHKQIFEMDGKQIDLTKSSLSSGEYYQITELVRAVQHFARRLTDEATNYYESLYPHQGESMSLQVSAPIMVEEESLAGLLVSAMEGGSNYWYMHLRNNFAPGCSAEDYKPGGKLHNEKLWEDFGGLRPFWHFILPFCTAGGNAVFEVHCAEENDGTGHFGKEFVLDRKAIQKGLDLFATSPEYAHHWRDFQAENDDAGTGDVFLQWCLFGEQIYG